MEKVIVSYNEIEKSILFSFKYKNEDLDINRVFNLKRKSYETCENLLIRIGENLKKVINKKLKKKNASECDIDIRMVSKFNSAICDIKNVSCYDLIMNEKEYLLEIQNVSYFFDINPPMIKNMNLPKKNIMSTCVAYPQKIETLHCDKQDIRYKWYRTNETYKSIDEAKMKLFNAEWIEISDQFLLNLTSEDIARIIKVVGTPYKGDRVGEEFECISNVLVSPSPEIFGFSKRHFHTQEISGENHLRVVSYNILANLYADSDFSRSTLFPCCPPYALQIDYRKQLILKEITGYNADIICLQEVDEKVFVHDLTPVLGKLGFEGVFKSKGGPTVSEGLATFYRSSKIRLKEECHFLLSQEMENNALFADVWQKVKQNENAAKVFTSRPTILHVAILEAVSAPNRLVVVGSTHLYFEPLSDHIRLLQAHVCLTLLRQIIELQESSNGEREVSLIFCGDFNSSPENAVNRLFTSQVVDEDDVDWKSKSGEEISGLSLCHDVELSSACGFPEFTNFTVGFKGCLDYVFYQSDKFEVEQFIPFPTLVELSENEALPSVKFPSDHVALIADLRWKNKS